MVSVRAAAPSEPDKEASAALFIYLIGCETRFIVYLVVRNVISVGIFYPIASALNCIIHPEFFRSEFSRGHLEMIAS